MIFECETLEWRSFQPINKAHGSENTKTCLDRQKTI